MQEENIVSQQKLTPSTEGSLTEKKKIKMSVKIFLALMWIAYIPVAFVIFAFSAMAGDSPYAPAWQVLTAMSLANGIPLLSMIALTYLTIKRNTIIYFLWFFAFLLVVRFLFNSVYMPSL